MSELRLTAKAAQDNPTLLAIAAENGLTVIIVDESESAPTSSDEQNTAPSARENGSPFGPYAQRLDRTGGENSEFSLLHPVIRFGAKGKKGSVELRAKLNTLPVTGECTLSDDAWGAIGKVMFENGLAGRTTKKGKRVALRMYSVRVKKDGNLDGRATKLMQDGAKLRFDHSNHTVRIVNGGYKPMKFGSGIKAPLARALKSMDLG